jgi:hypothetical protein
VENFNSSKWKLKKLRDTKVDSIIKYAQEQQKNCLINTVVIVISLISLFNYDSFVYNLINNTVTALNQISNSIKNGWKYKSTQFQVIQSCAINSSLLHLSLSTKEQIDLSSKISNGIFGDTIALRSKSDVLNRSLNKMSLDLQKTMRRR